MVEKAEALISLLKMVQTPQARETEAHGSDRCIVCKPVWLDAVKIVTQKLLKDVLNDEVIVNFHDQRGRNSECYEIYQDVKFREKYDQLRK